MRLTCPNCGVEYEVPEGLIPTAGKHVQCSACHTRWFVRAAAREELSEDQILRKLETRTGGQKRPRSFEREFGHAYEHGFDWLTPTASSVANNPEPITEPEPVAEAEPEPREEPARTRDRKSVV